jgi:hypothetical protein
MWDFRSRRKPFIVEIRSFDRYVQGVNLFYFFKKCFKEGNLSCLEFLFIIKTLHVTNLGKSVHLLEIV